MHTADVMESFLISLPMRKIKIVLLCPREVVKAFKKRENREQKDMSGVYTTVLLADSVTPLWMCDFVKTLDFKRMMFFYLALNKRFFPYINRIFISTKSCSVNSKLSLHSHLFCLFLLKAFGRKNLSCDIVWMPVKWSEFKFLVYCSYNELLIEGDKLFFPSQLVWQNVRFHSLLTHCFSAEDWIN